MLQTVILSPMTDAFPILVPWPETRAPPCVANTFAFEQSPRACPPPRKLAVETSTTDSASSNKRRRKAAPVQSASPTSSVHDDSPSVEASSVAIAHANHLAALPAHVWEQLQGAFVCSFELNGVYTADALTQSLEEDLCALAPAAMAVFQAARARGVHVLGVAPAHRRRGKWTPPIPGDPPRVYAGPARPPFREATVFSPVPSRKK